ncbi:MAG TPA: hypothetical protein VEY71_03210, partial [Chitinophagales bacterium]|nr:hypothetical protein [Chitinophagales bacterium]
SEGFEYVLVFSDDSVRYYTDGTLSLVLPYVLEYPSGQADPNDSTFELNVDGSTSYASFKNDTLILDDSHVDGGKAYYVRL